MAEPYWIELGFLPVEVAYCATFGARRRALKQCGIPFDPWKPADARCEWWERGQGKSDIILITLAKHAGKYKMAQVAGMIAHECMHVFRHIKEIIGEKEPSSEFEAYVMQTLVQHSMFAHAERRKEPWK